MSQDEMDRRAGFRVRARVALIMASSNLRRAGDMLRAARFFTRINLPGASEIPLQEACYNLADAIIGMFEEGDEL